jgi:4-diphosphocytidyl-2-C-methyl-D-erythritol kinase
VVAPAAGFDVPDRIDPAMPLRELARAKINLTLRVLGRRADGYHEIESLVAFAAIGDRLALTPGPECRLTVSGPFARDIDGPNLLETALVLLREHDATLQLGTVLLEKNLPVAAGLGGGSADAAALLRAVRRANPERAGAVAWHALAARLGADVPVCLAGVPALISGVGDNVGPLGAAYGLPPVAAVLVNPRLPLPTAQVYAALAAGPAPASAPPTAPPSPMSDLAALVDFMRRHGNDLERPATALLPTITDIKAALAAQPGCRIAAMSGSGPTCFGIFADDASAARAIAALASQHRQWWIIATQVVGDSTPDLSDATVVPS